MTALAAVVQFGRARRGGDDAACEDAILDLLVAMRRNGQLLPHFTVTRFGDGWAAAIAVPCADAWAAQFDGPDVARARLAVAAKFARAPRWRLLGKPAHATPDWRRSRRLLVFTTLLANASPVVDFDRGDAIPLCTLPLAEAERAFVTAWAHDYAATDDRWMASGALEAVAYRQLASPRSALLRDACAAARLVERATGMPCYAYLLRYHGHARGEAKRRCPGCGGAWARRAHGCRAFTFRCEACRLASHAGRALDGPASLAAIGSWRGR